MDDWVAAFRADELADGDYRLAELSGSLVAVYRIDGQFFAIEDVCSHDGGELAGGPVEGHAVECVRHGARFDLRSGAPLNPPAYVPVTVFPVRVADGQVWIRDHRLD